MGDKEGVKMGETMAEKQANKSITYGGLKVTMTSQYTFIWSDSGAGGKGNDLHVFQPASAAGGFRPLGSIALPRFGDPTDRRGTILVADASDSPSRPAVKSPTDYERIWYDQGTGAYNYGSFWRPVAPTGYTAVGHMAAKYWDNKPSTSAMWCVRSDLVSEGTYSEEVWNERGTGLKSPTSRSGPSPLVRYYDRPPGNLARVPLLKVPNQFADFKAPLPVVDRDNLPRINHVYDELEQSRVKPYVAYFPPTDEGCVNNIADPFCVLSRLCAWKVDEVFSNKGARDPDSKTYEASKGVSESMSKDFSHSAGVEVSASTGLFGVSFGVSFNYQFAYQEHYDYSEWSSWTERKDISIPANGAKVIFTRHITLKATRSNESWELARMGFNASKEYFAETVYWD
ncbi:hypothetical protein PCL_09633 [Purpureocillium lilacinum]|uniref:Insecticidal crystal toxin domain-containing protein n=1 Tax=Purpureocillium lilacinum TaxID=33203 RepID=A0A2U3DQF1_PURLI|nr:hypothetical protein PCL_09633 [Purpureocillium lilacinum]